MISSRDVRRNEHFIKKGSPRTHLYWLLKGRAVLLTDKAELVLPAGTVIGIPDLLSDTYSCDYVAVEDCTLYAISFESLSDLTQIYESQTGYDAVFLLAVVNTVHQILREFAEASEKATLFRKTLLQIREILSTLGAEYGTPKDYDKKIDDALSGELPSTEGWLTDFYHEFAGRPLQKMRDFYGGKAALVTGEIVSASARASETLEALDFERDYLETRKSLLLASNQKDLTQVLLSLARRVGSDRRQEILAALAGVYKFAMLTNFYPEEQTAMLGSLLDEYAGKAEEEEENHIEEEKDPRTEILAYAGLSAEDEVEFAALYKTVLKRSLEENTPLSLNLTMFLSFGLLDQERVGKETMPALCDLAGKLNLCETEQIYTLPRWLKEIYDGKIEPLEGHPETEPWAKVEYELDRILPSISAPLARETLPSDLIGAFLTAKKLEAALNELEETDISLFYRDFEFSEPEYGITSEIVKKRIPPCLVLLPGVSSEAELWSETIDAVGEKPTYFAFPIFLSGDLFDRMLATAARYRWELCRKMEGDRWDDVTEKSLTARYCDYLQFYKKNRELSPEMKEKLEQELARVENNYCEIFAEDYANWMKYESKGSFRLNKVTREILVETCPLPREAREALRSNPTLGKKIERLQNLREKDKKRLQTALDRYQTAGGTNDEPLIATLDFYNL